jgi:hypothetical protein
VIDAGIGGTRRRTTALLALGAALGIAAAIASLTDVRTAGRRLPDDVVARVNGVPIRRADYLRAVGALASDRRAALTEADRRHVLDRLIDEELLVQYGVDLGLVQSDRRVRGDLVSSVLAAQVASVDDFEPTEEELRAYYAEYGDFFGSPGRMRLAVLWVRGEPARPADEAASRALAAAVALRDGEEFASVVDRLGDQPVAPLPDGYLPPAKVREYVGPAVATAALALAPGEVSDPIRAASGVYVVQLVDREASGRPPLEEIEPQVRVEMKRRAGDDAVRAALERLRREGEVVTTETLP